MKYFLQAFREREVHVRLPRYMELSCLTVCLVSKKKGVKKMNLDIKVEIEHN